MAKVPVMDASLRTTTAPTIIQAGVKDNVLPTHARAPSSIFFRIRPGDTIANVLVRVKDRIGDARVNVRPALQTEAIDSGMGSPSFALVQRTVSEVLTDAIVTPTLTFGATDPRHFYPLSHDIYRFNPLRFRPEDLASVHGTNERAQVDDLAKGATFYDRFIQRSRAGTTASLSVRPTRARRGRLRPRHEHMSLARFTVGPPRPNQRDRTSSEARRSPSIPCPWVAAGTRHFGGSRAAPLEGGAIELQPFEITMLTREELRPRRQHAVASGQRVAVARAHEASRCDSRA